MQHDAGAPEEREAAVTTAAEQLASCLEVRVYLPLVNASLVCLPLFVTSVRIFQPPRCRSSPSVVPSFLTHFANHAPTQDNHLPDGLIDDLLSVCEAFTALCGVSLPNGTSGARCMVCVRGGCATVEPTMLHTDIDVAGSGPAQPTARPIRKHRDTGLRSSPPRPYFENLLATAGQCSTKGAPKVAVQKRRYAFQIRGPGHMLRRLTLFVKGG